MERDEQGRFLPRESQSSESGPKNYPPGPASRGAAAGARQARSGPWTYQPGVAEPSCASRGGTMTTLGVIAGAGIGAAMMFLLDPEQGRRRRERLTSAAEHAMNATTDAARHAWDVGSEKAIESAAAIYAGAPDTRDLRKFGRRLTSRASSAFGSATDSASETAHDWLDTAKSYLPRVHVHRAGHHSDRRVSPTAAGAGAAGALLLGLGAMWLFDPARGRGRRAWIGQKTNRVVNETGRFMRATGRHLANKSKGFYHQGRQAMAGASETLGDTTVAERVRSALGRIGLSSYSSVAVECAGGCVTLTGRCAPEETDTILGAVRNTYGVDRITNQMTTGTRYDAPASSAPASP